MRPDAARKEAVKKSRLLARAVDAPGHVFVYGTLRVGSAHPMAQRLQEGATHIGPAAWRGRLYSLGPHPAAVAHAGHLAVQGDLFRFDDATLLAELDAYEGLDTGRADWYVREVHAVRQPDGTRTPAWVYRYTGPVRRTAWISDGDWLAHLRRTGTKP